MHSLVLTCFGQGHNPLLSCDGERYPGWHVKIDLCDTVLENIDFPIVEYGVGKNSEPEDNDWIHCKVKNKVFHGYGGPDKLKEIFEKFLDWSDKHSEQHF